MKLPLAKRITSATVIASQNDPCFLYALNGDSTNIFDLSIRRGFINQYGHSGGWIRTTEDELNANSELIVEAFAVTHETGMTPRDLVERIEKLEKGLEKLLRPSTNQI